MHKNMNESQRHNVEEKKQVTEDLQYEPTHIKCKYMKN